MDIKQNALRTWYCENSWTADLKAMLERDGNFADIKDGPVIPDDWLRRSFDCAAA